MTPAGLPHSEILGSQPACGSPRLIAACYVLHRRSAPRHPPYTLISLTTQNPSHLTISLLPNRVVKERFSGPRKASPHLSRCREDRRELVEQIGFEPTTSALQGRRSPN